MGGCGLPNVRGLPWSCTSAACHVSELKVDAVSSTSSIPFSAGSLYFIHFGQLQYDTGCYSRPFCMYAPLLKHGCPDAM
ncbi:TPA: hypothetical protein ACH3X2_012935 [Trebouxia sp. C0005]